jgi:hypothetical protein
MSSQIFLLITLIRAIQASCYNIQLIGYWAFLHDIFYIADNPSNDICVRLLQLPGFATF